MMVQRDMFCMKKNGGVYIYNILFNVKCKAAFIKQLAASLMQLASCKMIRYGKLNLTGGS